VTQVKKLFTHYSFHWTGASVLLFSGATLNSVKTVVQFEVEDYALKYKTSNLLLDSLERTSQIYLDCNWS